MLDAVSSAVADAIRRGQVNPELRRRFLLSLLAKAQAAQRGGYGAASDPYGIRYRLPGSAHHNSPIGGYARPSATVNPMKRPVGGYGNGW
jgi:hypothetical protein